MDSIFGEIVRQLEQMYRQFQGVVAVSSILLGVFTCLFGYKIYKVLLGVFGFTAGGVLGMVVAGYVTDGGSTPILIGGAIGGVLGAVLAVGLYFVGVFLFGAAMGLMISWVALQAAGFQEQPLVLILAALVGGAMAIGIQKVVIILSTAAGGSWIAVTGVVSLARHEITPFGPIVDPEFYHREALLALTVFGGWLALTILGIVVQFAFVAGKGDVPSRRPRGELDPVCLPTADEDSRAAAAADGEAAAEPVGNPGADPGSADRDSGS